MSRLIIAIGGLAHLAFGAWFAADGDWRAAAIAALAAGAFMSAAAFLREAP